MTSADTTITVTVRPHWVNTAVLRPSARPIVQVDGEEHVAHWGRPLQLTVSPGYHQIRAFFRYRGTHTDLGVARRDIDTAAGDSWTFVARHGVTNGSGLRFVQVARA